MVVLMLIFMLQTIVVRMMMSGRLLLLCLHCRPVSGFVRPWSCGCCCWWRSSSGIVLLENVQEKASAAEVLHLFRCCGRGLLLLLFTLLLLCGLSCGRLCAELEQQLLWC